MDAVLSLSHAGLSLAAGGLTTLSPCVFPVLPLVVGGAVQAHRLAPVAMGVGMTGSFALVGLFLGALGPALGIDADSVRVFGAILLIAFAATLLVPRLGVRLGQWMAPMASSAQAASARLDGGSLGGALALGAVLGLVWSPCSGPLLASALALVASAGGAVPGALILGLFGLGAAIPLVAVAYASRSGLLRARAWVQGHATAPRRAFGALIGVTGVALLTGADKWLEGQLVAWLPDAWLALTTSI
ncbi:MAG: cytochrome c biogenesis CcdA family protein [Rhodoferax sp.]